MSEHQQQADVKAESAPEQSVDELAARIEELEQRQEQLEEEQETVGNLFEQFKAGKISRRTFLTTVSAVAGAGWMIGSASAAPSWGSSSGSIGTTSNPLTDAYVQNGTFQSLSTDGLSVTNAPYVSGQSNNIREEHGQASHATVSSAPSDGWDSAGEDITSVAFATAFSNSPKVFVQETPAERGALAQPTNISSTGFDARMNNYRANQDINADSDWVAIGE